MTRGNQRGIVTVELAAGLTMAVVLTIFLVALSLLGVAQAACAESSAQLARQAARGDEALLQEARDRAPEGARVSLDRDTEGVTARVSVRVDLMWVGRVELSAQHWAAYEPGVGP